MQCLHGMPHSQRLTGRGHIVHAHNAGAFFHRQQDGGHTGQAAIMRQQIAAAAYIGNAGRQGFQHRAEC